MYDSCYTKFLSLKLSYQFELKIPQRPFKNKASVNPKMATEAVTQISSQSAL